MRCIILKCVERMAPRTIINSNLFNEFLPTQTLDVRYCGDLNPKETFENFVAIITSFP